MILTIMAGLAVFYWLLLHRLGTLTGGLSAREAQAANDTYGWYGLYHHPLYLPLNIVRSIVFHLPGHHGQLLTRLPEVAFGASAVIAFAWLTKLWHGTRTALLTTALFATSAWLLHVSRLATADVLYLLALPTLLLGIVAGQRRPTQAIVFYGNILLWGSLLYLPGAIWLIALAVFWQRSAIKQGWLHFTRLSQRALYVFAGLVWVPLLSIDLTRPHIWQTWLGLPAHIVSPLTLLKQFGGVFLHLFVRGPQYPDIWLARAPILDIFTLVLCLVGIYFYIRHWRVNRSRVLASFFVVSALLVALNGPVGLSLLVPLLYICAATGIAFLLHEWLKVFPFNPLARGLGIGLVAVAISLSCVYNLRAYFVAWPNTSTTETTFRYHR